MPKKKKIHAFRDPQGLLEIALKFGQLKVSLLAVPTRREKPEAPLVGNPLDLSFLV